MRELNKELTQDQVQEFMKMWKKKTKFLDRFSEQDEIYQIYQYDHDLKKYALTEIAFLDISKAKAYIDMLNDDYNRKEFTISTKSLNLKLYFETPDQLEKKTNKA